jgi:fatty-acyl-CoA synthase
VVGVPDPIYGEAVCACIQLHAPDTLTADESRRYCRERLAPHNVPRRVLFLDQLPTTASGKVQKFRVRELALQALGLAPAQAGMECSR